VNHSLESGVAPKSRFGGQGVTPGPDSKYVECRGSWKTQVSLWWASPWNVIFFPSVLWHCLLGDREGIRPVKSWVLVC